jgi:hypothetical protein
LKETFASDKHVYSHDDAAADTAELRVCDDAREGRLERVVGRLRRVCAVAAHDGKRRDLDAVALALRRLQVLLEHLLGRGVARVAARDLRAVAELHRETVLSGNEQDWVDEGTSDLRSCECHG